MANSSPQLEDIPAAAGAFPQFDPQAVGDSASWQAIVAAAARITGVAAGGTVSPGGGMTVNIAASFLAIYDILYAAKAVTGVTVGAASSTDRRDSVVVSQPFALGATSYSSGGGAVTSITTLPLPYAIPSGATVAMANGDMVVLSGGASAGATSISINSKTPSAGAGWAASSIVTPAWVVAGTPNPAGGAGWTRTTSILPPVKPPTPTGAVLMADVYVEGSGATATTSILAGNIGDQTTPVHTVQKWSPISQAWTYVNATQFTIASNTDQTPRYATGSKLRWSESGVIKYGYVLSSSYATGTTTVNMVANTTYAMAVSPDAGSQFWCDSGSVPPDFTEWFSYAPTITGVTSPTVTTAVFKIVGHECHVIIQISGTSNATTKSVSAPMIAVQVASYSPGSVVNSGSALQTPAMISIFALQSSFGIAKDWSGGTFTATGTWACSAGPFAYGV